MGRFPQARPRKQRVSGEVVFAGIVKNPKILAGKPVIQGTRIPAAKVVDEVAGGASVEAVAKSYGVTKEQVQAALHYAAQLLEKSDPESADMQTA